MSEFDSNIPIMWVQRSIVIVLIGGLILQAYLILELFLAAIAWALVLAHVTWPLQKRLIYVVGNRPTVRALLMVGGVGVMILLPLLWFSLIIEANIADGYRAMIAYLPNGTDLPDTVLRIPWLGQALQDWINSHSGDSATINQQLMLWARQGAGQIYNIFGGIGRNAAKLAFASVTLFVMYRDGEKILRDIKVVLRSAIGHCLPRRMPHASLSDFPI